MTKAYYYLAFFEFHPILLKYQFHGDVSQKIKSYLYFSCFGRNFGLYFT